MKAIPPIEVEKHQVMPSDNILDGSMSEAITQSRISHTSDSANWQREYRRELFKLLVSYLNGINQFSSDSYDIDAEKQMDFLLNLLRFSDTEALRAQLGVDTARVQIALESWMSMRRRLGAFRSATGYFGWPGEQWAEFLRHLDTVPSAQAILAYVDLQGREGECGYVADTFDEDLARVFDALTRVPGRNGPKAFESVGRYNEVLLDWFREWDV
ncbi:hypothetical protein EK21DRAFT_119081 [Setomelanomma holmii]|uniref:Uncharacterized protein n=1 Tax=Setomelanomma holmii TaxID=210430 RepID=A0A9P4LFD1_9PLEO|nr:hypothetical protein EK21DRAFT_119081 [Setomelanomma holmii]